MVEIMKKETSHWWWIDTHNTSKRSPWLQSTLEELDEKTKAMLKLIDQDADSFKQRAEMYYKKRPELISMVKDFYKAHRSLAEEYDQVKLDTKSHLLTTFGTPFMSLVKHKEDNLIMSEATDQTNQSFYSHTSDDVDDYLQSEVDDLEHEEEIQIVKVKEEKEEKHVEKLYVVPNYEVLINDEIMKLRVEIARLKEENRMQMVQLSEKDEEKRETIRQLSFAVGVIKDENLRLKKYIVRDSFKKWIPFEFSKLKEKFLSKLFSGSSSTSA